MFSFRFCCSLAAWLVCPQHCCRGMSKLDRSQSFDGKPLSKLASKVPVPKKTGNITGDAMAVIQRDAFVKIVDALTKHPEWVLPIHGIVTSQDFLSSASQSATASSGDKPKHKWTGKYDTVKSLPKTWKMNLLEKVSGMSSTLMAHIDAADSDGIEVLFQFEMHVKSSQPLPECCQDQTVCTAVFMKRSTDNGCRCHGLFQRKGISPMGEIDYGDLCFRPEFNKAGECKVIKHCCGSSGHVSRFTPINVEFTMDNNIFDMEATMECEEAKHHLHRFFNQHTPVHQHKFSNKKGDTFKDFADGVKEVYEEKQRSAEGVSIPVLASAAAARGDKRRAEQRMEVTRGKLAEAAAARLTKRRVTGQVPVAPPPQEVVEVINPVDPEP